MDDGSSYVVKNIQTLKTSPIQAEFEQTLEAEWNKYVVIFDQLETIKMQVRCLPVMRCSARLLHVPPSHMTDLHNCQALEKAARHAKKADASLNRVKELGAALITKAEVRACKGGQPLMASPAPVSIMPLLSGHPQFKAAEVRKRYKKMPGLNLLLQQLMASGTVEV